MIALRAIFQSRAFTCALALLPAVVLAVILVLGALARCSVPNFPIPDFDSPGYLSPALSWLGGEGFNQAAGRDWLYPAFLAFVLKAAGSFSAIAVFQKLLGFCSILFLAATWRLWISLLNLGPIAECLALLAGAVPAYFLACNSVAVFFELRLRPESILSCCVFAQLFCVLAYVRYRWCAPRPILSLIFGVLAFVLAYACCLLKPSWLFALVTTTLPIFLGLFGSFPSRIRWLTPLGGLALAALLLWLPARLFYVPDSASRTFLPSTLVTIHAKLIMATLAKQAAQLPESDPRRAQLQNILAAFDKEFPIAASRPGTYESMGFDPDYLYYKSSLMPVIWENSGRSDEGLRAFCLRAYRDTILDQPFAMAGKIGTQFHYFLFPDTNSFYRSRIELKDAYHAARPVFPEIFDTPGSEFMNGYWRELHALATAAPRLGPRPLARSISDFAGLLGFPLVVLFLFALVACHLREPLRSLRIAGWTALLIYSAPAANAFTIAVSHALDNSRYRQSYGSFVVFALTVLTVFLATALVTALCRASRNFVRP